MYFVPISRAIPIFGQTASKDYVWTLNISPGFFGQGMITGLVIPLHMLFGATAGWAILAPIARQNGWAPGAIDDWQSGPRGWFIWISVTGLMADAAVKLTWFITRPLWIQLRGCISSGISRDQDISRSADLETLLPRTITEDDAGNCQASSEPPLKPRSVQLGFLVATLICVSAVQVSFKGAMPWYHVIVGVLITLPMAIVGIRSLAQADFNPESALCK